MLPENAGPYIRVEEERTVTGEVRLGLLKAVLEKKKPFRFTASGFSMSPIIRDRDILTIEPLPSGSPVPGDVVAFELPDTQKLIVHRVIQCEDNGILIKADNGNVPDGMIPRTSILGIVTRVERNNRTIYAGLGREKRLIAFLSRHGLLMRLFRFIRLPYLIGAAVQKKMQARSGCSAKNSGSRTGNPPGQ